MQIHATTVAFGGRAVALRGPSGAGKSDFALRLIGQGAMLVADDRTNLCRHGETVWASPPEGLAGLLEVRGVGIVRQPWRRRARLRLVVDLVSRDAVPRLPPPRQAILLALALPLLALDPREASAAVRLRLALARRLAGPDAL